MKKFAKMRVMSLNLEASDCRNQKIRNGDDRPFDRIISEKAPLFNDLLLGEDIDIAGLQEICSKWEKWFDEGMDPSYAWTGKKTLTIRQGGHIIYKKDKFELIEDGHFWLGEGTPTELESHEQLNDWGSKFDRMCKWGLFREKESDSVFLFCDTHLDWISDEVSGNQARVLVEKVKEMASEYTEKYSIDQCPVFIMGDMNSRPTSPAYRYFTEVYFDSRVKSTGATVPIEYSSSPGPNYVAPGKDYIADYHLIDFIHVSENVNVENYKMIHTSTNVCEYGPYITDHNAIIIDVNYQQ